MVVFVLVAILTLVAKSSLNKGRLSFKCGVLAIRWLILYLEDYLYINFLRNSKPFSQKITKNDSKPGIKRKPKKNNKI